MGLEVRVFRRLSGDSPAVTLIFVDHHLIFEDIVFV